VSDTFALRENRPSVHRVQIQPRERARVLRHSWPPPRDLVLPLRYIRELAREVLDNPYTVVVRRRPFHTERGVVGDFAEIGQASVRPSLRRRFPGRARMLASDSSPIVLPSRQDTQRVYYR
jgi:hypothetical protein